MIPMACSYTPAHPYPLNDKAWREVVWQPTQREKTPGGGASGKGVRNRIEAGGANCPSVSSGLAVSGESEIDGFFGGSTTVRSRGSLRARLFFFFDALLASVFNGFSGGITGVAVGKSSGTLRVHPGASRTRPIVEWCLLAHQSQRIPRGQSSRRRSLKRAQPECGRALTSRSFALRAPSLAFGAGARVAPYGCHAVNWSG
jgi:hypothetical protein